MHVWHQMPPPALAILPDLDGLARGDDRVDGLPSLRCCDLAGYPRGPAPLAFWSCG
jgi:hypothetical protein